MSGQEAQRSREVIWDVGDCAKVLRVSPRLVQKLAHEGRLPHFRVGRYMRFNPDAVREWMKAASSK